MALRSSREVFPLDPHQRMAVESDARVTLVGGSAGVGMTQVVVGRVAHLIRLDHHPTTIACLTSRGSVDVLTLRLAEHDLVAGRLLELFVGDVASLANFFLRSEGARALGISSSYSLWPPSRCIDETLARWKESGRPVVGRGDVRRALEWHWQNRSFGRLNALQNFPKPIWAEIVAIYEQAKRAQDALDHSDVLFLATDLVDIVGSGKMSVQDFPLTSLRTRHLVVDQGEEVTIEEADFLLKLAVHCESLLVAWDPNQGVKADQGSDLAGALRVRFRDLHRVELAVGHDTTEQLAETLVVLTRASENLGAIRQSGVKQSEWPPLLLEIQGSLTDVHVSCIEELNNLLNQGLTPRDFALLYRRGNPVGLLRTLLAHHGIPSRLLAEPEVSKGSDGRAVAALLTALLNPKDIFSLQAAAAPGYPNKDRLLSRVQARRLGSLILADSPDHWEEVRRYLEGLGEDDPGRRAVAYLLEAMDRLEAVVSDPDATLEGVVEAAAAMVEAGKAPSQQGHGDRELLRLRQLADRVPVGPWDTVRDQVQDLVDRWGMGQAGRPDSAGGVAIGPIEASKGQRWRVVFLLDVQDGKLPGQDAGRAHDRLTREERLFYLAASRSSEVLFFLMPQPGGSTDSQPCRFLTPLLDGGVVESVRLPPAGARGALCESQP